MGLREWFRKSWAGSSWTTGSTAFWLPSLGAGVVSPYAQNAWVYAGVSSKMRLSESAPLRIMKGKQSARDQGKPIADTDPVARLFARPSPLMDGPRFFAAALAFMDLEGEMFAVKFGDGARFARKGEIPRELVMVHPVNVKENIDYARDVVSTWTVNAQGRSWTVPAESMWHVATFNPNNRHRGLAAIQAALLEIRGDYRATEYQEGTLKNGAIPSGYVQFPAGVPEPAMKAARDSWDQRHGGPQNAARTAFLSGGMTYTPIGQTMKNLGVEAMKADARERIKAVLGVSEYDFGDIKDGNLASMKVAEAATWRRSIIPWFRRMESAIDEEFFADMQGAVDMWAAWDVSGVEALQSDYGTTLDNAAKLVGIGYSPNEVNDRLSLGMEKQDDDVSIDPQAEALNGAQITGLLEIVAAVSDGTLTPEGAIAAVTVAFPTIDEAEAKAIIGGAKEKPPEPAPVVAAPGAGPPVTPANSRETPETRETREKALTDSSERTVKTAVARAFKEIKAEVVSRLRAADTGKAFKSWDGKATTPVAQLVADRDFWTQRMRAAARPAIRKVQRIVARDAGIEMQASVRWDSPAFRKQAAARIGQMVDLAPKYRKKLATRIASTIRKNGFDVRAVEEVIDAEFGQYISGNAETIARTEVGMLRSGIRHVVAKDNGYRSKVWQTIIDGSERPSHEATHRERVGIDDKFSNGLAYPLEVGGPAEEIINCRCLARYQKRAP